MLKKSGFKNKITFFTFKPKIQNPGHTRSSKHTNLRWNTLHHTLYIYNYHALVDPHVDMAISEVVAGKMAMK